MGVIHKLRPEIKNFILEEKKVSSALSCRTLASLIENKFNLKVSKSTINAVFQTSGLSMPVGRRLKERSQRREKLLLENPFLAAADYLAGGFAKKIAEVSPELLNEINSAGQVVRCLKIDLSGEISFYLDSQIHTVWPSQQISPLFSTTICNINSYINKYFQENAPMVLLEAPGYDTPSKEFFEFTSNLDSVSKITLYNNEFKELEVRELAPSQKRYFIFGVWPWQFTGCRKDEIKTEFKPFNFTPLNQDFYLAEVAVELSQTIVNKRITLRGCLLKKGLNEEPIITILSNLEPDKASIAELVNLYLNHWPNLEEGWQDFSRKIENFISEPGSERVFPSEKLNFDAAALQERKTLLNAYLGLLDLYVRQYFLPPGYENMDFPTLKERFYRLKTLVDQQENALFVTFQPPPSYPFLKDLEYACRRVNERGIIFGGGKRIWCDVSGF